MLVAIYALIALCAAMFVANAATSFYLWRTLSKLGDLRAELGDERVALAQSDADLATSRANEETAVRIARDATELVDAIRASNAHDRKAQDDVDTAKIHTASTATELVAAGASVWQSMPTPEGATIIVGQASHVQPAATTEGNSARGKR